MSLVQTLRASLLETRPRLSCERLHYLREAYSETEGQPTAIRRARVLDMLLSGMTIFIDENPIVGTMTRYRCGIQPYPEYSCDWMTKAVESMVKEGKATEGDTRLVEEAVAYWRDKCISARTRALISSENNDMPAFSELSKAYVLGESVNLVASRINLDYGKVLSKGLEGIIAEAEDAQKKLPSGSLDAYEKRVFLDGVIMACGATIKFARRYAKLAEEMIRQEQSPERRKELERIAAACQWVPAKPARTFYEAIQSFWFIHLTSQIENPSTGRGPGRLPIYMYPFYEGDKASGKITREGALGLLEMLFLRIAEIGRFMPSEHPQRKYGEVMLQTITLGGVTPEGDDATNELDLLLLEAKHNTRLPEPPIEVMYHNRLSSEFLSKCAELVATGIGMPTFINNDIAIQRWLDHGATLEDSRDCCMAGCVDTVVSHSTAPLASGDLNMPKLLEMALNNGRDPQSGRQVGPKTGDADSFASWDDLYNAVAEQLRYVMPTQRQFPSVCTILKSQITPAVFASALVDDCIRNGKEVAIGGARYSMDYGTISGVIDVADSLAAVKKVVFEQRLASVKDVLEALSANFKGHEKLHRLLLESPKYGNDDDYVDQIAKRLYNLFDEEHQKYPDHLGRRRKTRAITFGGRFSYGAKVGALPSGRKSGMPLAEGSLCPEAGMDSKGLEALLSSAAMAIDNVQYGASMLFIKIDSSRSEEDDWRLKLLKVVKKYMDLGGHYVQFTVSDTDTLRDARLHPENYPDLMVGVSALTAFYANLDPAVRDDLVEKTTYSLD